MRKSRVVRRLREDQPVVFYCLHLNDPSVWELASLIGPDCLWLDLEHHVHSVETAGELIRAARVGSSDVIARPAKGEFMRMQRLLETGVQGIMYPRCEGPDEAREVVKWCKFAPMGQRGFDGGNPDMPYLSMELADYVSAANEQTFVIIQIEDEPTSHLAEEILNVDGVDGVMLGKADFSVLSGFPGDFDHPRVQQALDRLASAARNTGKHWGTTVTSLDDARQLTEAGGRLLFSGADIVAVKNAITELGRSWQAIGVQFESQMGESRSNPES